MKILHEIAREQGYLVVLVTYDPRVEDIADRILWLEDGKLVTESRNTTNGAGTLFAVCV